MTLALLEYAKHYAKIGPVVWQIFDLKIHDTEPFKKDDPNFDITAN